MINGVINKTQLTCPQIGASVIISTKQHSILEFKSQLDMTFFLKGSYPATVPEAKGRGLRHYSHRSSSPWHISLGLQRLENLFAWDFSGEQPGMTGIINVVTSFDPRHATLGNKIQKNDLKGEKKIRQCNLWWEEVYSEKLPIAYKPTISEGEVNPGMSGPWKILWPG